MWEKELAELLDRLRVTMEDGNTVDGTHRRRGPWFEVVEYVAEENQTYAYWARLDDSHELGRQIVSHPFINPSELDLDLMHMDDGGWS